MYLLETYHDGDLITQVVFQTLSSVTTYVDKHELHSSASKRTLLFRLREQSDGSFIMRSLAVSSKRMRELLLAFGAYSKINSKQCFHDDIATLMTTN